MFDRRRRHAGFDQLDPPAIQDLVVGFCGDSYGPAEMMGDPHARTHEYPGPQVCPPSGPACAAGPEFVAAPSTPTEAGQESTCPVGKQMVLSYWESTIQVGMGAGHER